MSRSLSLSLSLSLKNLSLLMTVELLFKEVDDLMGEFEVEVFELDGESLVPVLRFKFVFWYWAEMRSIKTFCDPYSLSIHPLLPTALDVLILELLALTFKFLVGLFCRIDGLFKTSLLLLVWLFVLFVLVFVVLLVLVILFPLDVFITFVPVVLFLLFDLGFCRGWRIPEVLLLLSRIISTLKGLMLLVLARFVSELTRSFPLPLLCPT